ncbi:Alpha/Beta hydrolase protein [Dactylonectria estremocensis]|uniref:Alpha/Beta hydrolase protein n=1 Tax=Dactylonectria estremocensis TaxID=1079267 RepID=A0A9P9JF41_9HYPO|nr:Alpha/Beta hydrolase protein [Dactylonectria estremocensis]
MVFPDPDLKALAFETAPTLDIAWLEFEEELKRRGPPRVFKSVLERQPIYAQECRESHAKMMAPGARDFELSQGVERKEFTIPSSVDGFAIPVLQLDLTEHQSQEPEIVIIYYHGGGLRVGEADSEELSCRHLVKSDVGRVRLYSIGYRLMPSWPATTCLSDSLDGFSALRSETAKNIVVGSSSGGQMAAAVSLVAPRGTIHGVLLRCPVTADGPSGKEYIPERLRPYHTSVSPSFVTYLIGYLQREIPRDGLEKLPLEAAPEQLQDLPRTWIQLSTNDTIYSDGLCYGMALKEAGVDVQVELEKGWPHTFWLKAPELAQSLKAEKKMTNGLKWILR